MQQCNVFGKKEMSLLEVLKWFYKYFSNIMDISLIKFEGEKLFSEINLFEWSLYIIYKYSDCRFALYVTTCIAI